VYIAETGKDGARNHGANAFEVACAAIFARLAQTCKLCEVPLRVRDCVAKSNKLNRERATGTVPHPSFHQGCVASLCSPTLPNSHKSPLLLQATRSQNNTFSQPTVSSVPQVHFLRSLPLFASIPLKSTTYSLRLSPRISAQTSCVPLHNLSLPPRRIPDKKMLAALFLQLLVALCFGPAVAFPFRLRVPGRGYNATSPGNTTTVTAQCISPLTTGSADAYMGHSLNCSGKPYFPERYTCWDGYRLCPRGARACGTDRITYDCYYSSQYRYVSKSPRWGTVRFRCLSRLDHWSQA